MISKNTIEKVFETMQVEEVIGDFVHLKKSGSNYKGLSPFSNERTPSFMVSPVKQIWKDFSSGKGGNAIAFLMEYEHFTYPEAIRYLANKYQIEIEETESTDEQKVQANERESMYLVAEYAQSFFQKSLHQTEEGKAIGLTYFKERGFTNQIIEKFKLGYSPNEWTAFTDDALGKGYQLKYLDSTGLTIVKEDKKFDRFKGRIMFPIHSMSGRVLGFGGRILTNDKKSAKYLNSPESEIYHKSKVLYGIYYAKQAIAKSDNCYLVEGYTDVIQMHQSGIENIVASSGTALTPEQIRLINRLTPNITLLYDGDSAGIRASLRGVDLILEQGMNVRICPFPEGEDPDSFARKNSYEDIVLYLEENTQDFIQFKASLLAKEAEGDPIKKAEVIRDMVKSIYKIQDPIKQELYVKECASIMEVSESVIFSTLSQISKKESSEANKSYKKEQKELFVTYNQQEQQVKEKINRMYVLEHELIKHLLLYGNKECEFEDVMAIKDENFEIIEQKEIQKQRVFEKIYLELHEDEIEESSSFFREIYAKAIQTYQSNDELKISDFVNGLSPELAQKVSAIIMEDENRQLHKWEEKDIVVKPKEADVHLAVFDAILNLRLHYIEKKIKEIQQMIQQPAEDLDRRELLEVVMSYVQLQKVIFEKLNRVVN